MKVPDVWIFVYFCFLCMSMNVLCMYMCSHVYEQTPVRVSGHSCVHGQVETRGSHRLSSLIVPLNFFEAG